MTKNQQKRLMRVDAYYGRYLALYEAATVAERLDGAAWYGRFSAILDTLATKRGVTLEMASAITAILSPMQTVASNLEAASMVLAERFEGVPALPANVEKAIAYLDGDASALRGPKVTAFHAAILGDPRASVVDTHMIDAVLDLVTTATITPAQTDAMRHALTLGADIVGETVPAFQAITWNVTRRTKGGNLTDWQYLEAALASF